MKDLPKNDTGLDRPGEGPEGGATAEEILAAAAKASTQGWLEVERLLSIAGSSDPRVTQLLLDTLKDGQFRNKAAGLAKYLKDPAALARFLEAAKGAGDDYTRGAALKACACMGGQGVYEAAAEILHSSRPGGMLASCAAEALGILGTTEAAKTLVEMLRGAVGTPQASMFVEALSRVRSPEALAELGQFVNDESQDPRLREQMIGALGRTGDASLVPELLKAANESRSDEVRSAALKALGLVGDPAGVQELVDLLHGGDDGKKLEAAEALQGVTNKAAGRILEEALSKPMPAELRPYVVTALGKAGGKSSVETLAKILADPAESEGLRGTAARSMGQIGDASAAPALLDALEAAPRSSTAYRTQVIGALLGTAGPDQLPRLEKLCDAAPPQTPEWFMLDGLVKGLHRKPK
jgi:HEAT repeat protein